MDLVFIVLTFLSLEAQDGGAKRWGEWAKLVRRSYGDAGKSLLFHMLLRH
jgi:hypothetical protein